MPALAAVAVATLALAGQGPDHLLRLLVSLLACVLFQAPTPALEWRARVALHAACAQLADRSPRTLPAATLRELLAGLSSTVASLDGLEAARAWWPRLRPPVASLLEDLAAHLDEPPVLPQSGILADWAAECAAALLEVPGVRELQEATGREVSIAVGAGPAGPVHRARLAFGRHAIEGEDRATDAAAVESLRDELQARGVIA